MTCEEIDKTKRVLRFRGKYPATISCTHTYHCTDIQMRINKSTKKNILFYYFYFVNKTYSTKVLSECNSNNKITLVYASTLSTPLYSYCSLTYIYFQKLTYCAIAAPLYSSIILHNELHIIGARESNTSAVIKYQFILTRPESNQTHSRMTNPFLHYSYSLFIVYYIQVCVVFIIESTRALIFLL